MSYGGFVQAQVYEQVDQHHNVQQFLQIYDTISYDVILYSKADRE